MSFKLICLMESRIIGPTYEFHSYTGVKKQLYDTFRAHIFDGYRCLNPLQTRFMQYIKKDHSVHGMTSENASIYLIMVKIFDLLCICYKDHYRIQNLSYRRSTYDIRTRALELLYPKLTTTEAYTYTLDPTNFNEDFLKDPSNWVPERNEFYHQLIIPNLLPHIENLSSQLEDHEYSVIIFSGNTASGKSSRCELLYPNTDKGPINIDHEKALIKTHTTSVMRLTDEMVHQEASKGPLKNFREKIFNDPNFNFIYDARITSPEDYDKIVFAACRQKGIRVLEMDVPLLTTFVRVLGLRSPTGEEACVHPDAMIQGFRDIRQSRKAIMDELINEDRIRCYEIFYTDNNGETHLVASKSNQGVGQRLQIHSQEHYNEVLKEPTDQEMELELKQTITEQFVADLVQKSIIPQSAAANILRWKNFTVQQAVKFHAEGISLEDAQMQAMAEVFLLAKYGQVSTMPFSGSWLHDFPEVFEHIKSEQLLHIRGVDNKGEGICWRTRKFAWNFNRQFNPEANGGFQMKIGYFLLDSNHIEIFNALKPISEEMRQELIQDGCYRLFVHPEAYAHFLPLHQINIPYVKPEDSPFIGSPTSSYRSWVVRRVVSQNDEYIPIENTKPFIVKFGVGSQTNPSKLLTREEIQTSIVRQNDLDKTEDKESILLFPERFGFIPNFTTIPAHDRTYIPSGNIIREFPDPLLNGDCKIFSLASVMSPERLNYPGLCSLYDTPDETDSLPLIFSMIKRAIDIGSVHSSYEYCERYFNQFLWDSLEEIIFGHGLSLPLHAQNLCIVLDKQGNLPIKFCLRDFGDIKKNGGIIRTHSWFYRYNVFIKLLNIITLSDKKYLPPASGLPTQLGLKEIPRERSVYQYLDLNVNSSFVRSCMNRLSISTRDYHRQIHDLDETYYRLLRFYFDFAPEELLDRYHLLSFPAAEAGSSSENKLEEKEAALWSRRKMDHVARSSLSPEELNSLSFRYEEGHGVRPDILEAMKLRILAAKQGLTYVQYYLGMQYLRGGEPRCLNSDGFSIPVNLSKAVKWLARAAEKTDHYTAFYAKQEYADLLYHGCGVRQNRPLALSLYESVANSDFGKCTRNNELRMNGDYYTGSVVDEREEKGERVQAYLRERWQQKIVDTAFRCTLQ